MVRELHGDRVGRGLFYSVPIDVRLRAESLAGTIERKLLPAINDEVEDSFRTLNPCWEINFREGKCNVLMELEIPLSELSATYKKHFL